MPYYEITETLLYQLKDAIKNGKIFGVGMLSQFLGIYIDQSWETEDVVIASMYFPSSTFCTFDFPRKRAFIREKSKVQRYDLPSRQTKRFVENR